MDPSTAAQTLLASPSLPAETLRVIATLLGNLAREPTNEKFRKVNLSNAKIKSTIADVPGATEVLLASGFVRAESSLECAPGVDVGVTAAAGLAALDDACSEAANAPFAFRLALPLSLIHI